MRTTLLLACLIASCAKAPSERVLKPGIYFGAGRDALCVMNKAAPQHFTFIAFAGHGDSNCAAEGEIEHSANGWALVPAGEGGCRIPLRVDGDSIAIGAVPAACAYYCGPGATLNRQAFRWKDTSAMLLVEQPLGHGGTC